MRKIILSLLAVLAMSPAFATDIKGLVVDGEGKPLSYASVFLKANPSVGTITDEEGKFDLTVDYAKNYADTLIISFIGYRDRKESIYNLNGWIDQQGPGTILKFKMEDDNLYISEARIVKKKGKKSKYAEMENILELVRQRMDIDFPEGEKAYRMKADTYVKRDGRVLGMEEDIGTVTETTGKDKDGTISFKSKFKTDVHKNSLDPKVRAYLDSVKENAESKEDSLASSVDPAKIIAMGWNDYPIYIFQKLSHEAKEWTINKISDDEFLLRAEMKQGMLGIVRVNYEIILRVNAHTYGLKSYYQNANVKCTIPFGYKLTDDEIRAVNGLTGMDLKQFKVKKLDINAENSAFFVRDNGRLVPTEKSYSAVGSAFGKKNSEIKIDGAVKMNVLSVVK